MTPQINKRVLCRVEGKMYDSKDPILIKIKITTITITITIVGMKLMV